ncbi:MAG: hypothetical protein VXZ18_13565, partial [Pseudomonadota bacterium]|nr:hypothetical protein [Pseudomonadota bacterium]
YFLTQILGTAKAKELYMLSPVLSGKEAERLGLVTLAVEPGQALDEALSLPDAATRQGVMEKLENMLRDDAVIVQPYWRSLFRHTRPNVVGAEMHPDFAIPLYRLGFAD